MMTRACGYRELRENSYCLAKKRVSRKVRHVAGIVFTNSFVLGLIAMEVSNLKLVYEKAGKEYKQRDRAQAVGTIYPHRRTELETETLAFNIT